MQSIALTNRITDASSPAYDLAIDLLSAKQAENWDAFVRSQPDGLPTHLTAWQEIIARSFGVVIEGKGAY